MSVFLPRVIGRDTPYPIAMIRFDNVSKRFGPHIVALRNISFDVAAGEMVLLTGPSGAGKTTLLRTILAAERPDEGEIYIAGRNIARLRASAIPYLRRNIGVVFQDFQLLRRHSVQFNVQIPLQIQGFSPDEIQSRCDEILSAVGLADRCNATIETLSGGEQQRIAIARAIVARPPILLCDEPTGNLDPTRSHDILQLLSDIARHGTTVLIATHDPMVVAHADAQRVIQLEQGCITYMHQGVTATPPLADADLVEDTTTQTADPEAQCTNTDWSPAWA